MSTSTPTEPTTPTDAATRPAETAPSAVYAEAPTFTRMAGLVGLGMFVLGAAVVIATKATGTPRFVPEGWGYLFAATGLVLMLYHSVRDTEAEVRRLYGMLGGAWLLLGLAAAVIPGPVFEKAAEGATKEVGYNLLPWGAGAGLLGLLFLIPFTRNETDEAYRRAAVTGLLAIGGVMTVGSLVYGAIKPDFLAGPGLALALLGLGFLCAYFSQVDTSEGTGYTVAFGLGALGAVVAIAALTRTAAPTLLYEGSKALRLPNGSLDTTKAIGRAILFAACFGVAAVALVKRLAPWARLAFGVVGLAGVALLLVATFNDNTLTVHPKPFLVPNGIILMGVGVLYLGVALGICSDNQFVTLTRRELGSFFVSPVGYIVLLGMSLAAWVGYAFFLTNLERAQVTPEPIVQQYFFAVLTSIFAILFFVPALTMRLFAEEQRTGTMEVLLTAPVTEPAIVLSKFVAVWVFFMVSWLPFGLYLVALRIEVPSPFDYRPLLSFYLALGVSGAAFLAMGLFFSTLTRNQVVAAVITFVGMLLLLLTVAADRVPFFGATFKVMIRRLSYYDLWEQALAGQLLVRDLLVWLSVAVLWLFLSVKSLEVRKWS